MSIRMTSQLVAGCLAVASCSNGKQAPTNGNGRGFVLPGWEDVIIGRPPPRDVELTCDKPNEIAECGAMRSTAPIKEVKVRRRPDKFGVMTVHAFEVSDDIIERLKAQWGKPSARPNRGSLGEDRGALWCSFDATLAASISERTQVLPAMVVITAEPDTWLIQECMLAAQRNRSQTPAPKKAMDEAKIDKRREITQRPANAAAQEGILTPSRVIASSTHKPGAGYTFTTANLIDRDVTTSWQPVTEDKVRWVHFEFDTPVIVSSIAIANGFQREDQFGDEFVLNDRISRGRVLFGDGTAATVTFGEQQRDLVRFDVARTKTRVVTIAIDDVWRGSKWRDLAISEIEIHGTVAASRKGAGTQSYDCQCWTSEMGANAKRDPCSENERLVWLETGPCEQ